MKKYEFSFHKMHVVITTDGCRNSIWINDMFIEHQDHDTEDLAHAAIKPTAIQIIDDYMGWYLATYKLGEK